MTQSDVPQLNHRYVFFQVEEPTDNSGPVIATLCFEHKRLTCYPFHEKASLQASALQERKESMLWNNTPWDRYLEGHVNSCANHYSNPRLLCITNPVTCNQLDILEKLSREEEDPVALLRIALGNIEDLCIEGHICADEAHVLFNYAQFLYQYGRKKAFLPIVVIPPLIDVGTTSARASLQAKGELARYRFQLIDREQIVDIGVANGIRADGEYLRFWIGDSKEHMAPLLPNQPRIDTDALPLRCFAIHLQNGRTVSFWRETSLDDWSPYMEACEAIEHEYKANPWPISEALDRAWGMEPECDYELLYLALHGERCFLREKYEEAIATYCHLGELINEYESPDHWQEVPFQRLESWGHHFDGEGMYKEAAQCLEAAYERFATSEIPVMDWGILARILSATGRWEKGLYILKSTLPPSSNNAQTEWVRASLFLTMGKILDDAGDLNGCLNANRECIQIGLENEDEDGDFDWENVGAALHNMGLACERRGRLDEAINYFEQAYEIAEEPIALERIEKLKARKEQG